MENLTQNSNVPQPLTDSLRLLQFEQRTILGLLYRSSEKDLREFLSVQLDQCEKHIDKAQNLIKIYYHIHLN